MMSCLGIHNNKTMNTVELQDGRICSRPTTNVGMRVDSKIRTWIVWSGGRRRVYRISAAVASQNLLCDENVAATSPHNPNPPRKFSSTSYGY